MKPVAREGDASAAAGKTPYTGATSGTWTPGSVTETTADRASSDGAKVVTQAKCSFSFSGTNGTSAVTGSSTVTLSPGSLLLSIDGATPLVDGDSAKDSFGNTVSVSSSAILRTA